MAEATRAIESLANEQIRAARIRTGEGYFRGVWRRLSADKLSLAALIVLFGIIAVSVAAPAINDGILHQDPNRGAVDTAIPVALRRSSPRHGRFRAG